MKNLWGKGDEEGLLQRGGLLLRLKKYYLLEVE